MMNSMELQGATAAETDEGEVLAPMNLLESMMPDSMGSLVNCHRLDGLVR
jgi:hypothetical protein